jgi:hypothetical protein
MTMRQASETNLKACKQDFRRPDLSEGELPYLFPYVLIFLSALRIMVGRHSGEKDGKSDDCSNCVRISYSVIRLVFYPKPCVLSPQ